MNSLAPLEYFREKKSNLIVKVWIFEKSKEVNSHAAWFLLEMSYNCSWDEFLKIFGSKQKFIKSLTHMSVAIVCISNGKTHII